MIMISIIDGFLKRLRNHRDHARHVLKFQNTWPLNVTSRKYHRCLIKWKTKRKTQTSWIKHVCRQIKQKRRSWRAYKNNLQKLFLLRPIYQILRYQSCLFGTFCLQLQDYIIKFTWKSSQTIQRTLGLYSVRSSICLR